MAGSSSNYIPQFAPQSHFFTNPVAITQSPEQAFGPVSTDDSPAEVFHVTSSFTLTADAKAFAICTGVVLVQPQTGNDSLVNLILRPFKQPISGLNIKYFIYRGLKKADFFTGGLVLPGTTGNSDFINKINAAFGAFYANGIKPDFLAAYIGFDPANQPDSMPIASLFFKQSVYTTNNGQPTETPQTAFELPLIAMGASLGNFATGECGIDIVLNYGDYQLPVPNDEFVFDLAYARDNDYAIDLSTVTDDFKRKLIKEQIFQFLDAAAYFGFHSTEQGIVTIDNNGTKVKKTGNAVYTDVIQHFQTKNNLYLYIQSDRTRSYNFYENYGRSDSDDHSLLAGYTPTTLVPQTYDTKGWPLIIDKGIQAHNNASNLLYLQFVTDNNSNTMLYGQVAQIDNAQSNNFCDADNLKLPDNTDDTPSTLTKAIVLSNPATGPNGTKQNIATFNILLYQGVVYDYISAQVPDGQGGALNVLAQPNFFDDVFDLLNATPLLKASDNIEYSILSSQKVKLINHFYNNTQYGISAVQTTTITDVIDTGDTATPTLSRVTYMTDSVDILNNVVAITGAVTADTQSSPSVSGAVTVNKTYALPTPFYYDIQVFTDSTQLINGLLLKTTDNSVPNKIILGLTKAEDDLLSGLINTNNLGNPRLYLISLFPDNNHLISTENIVYRKYKVALVGETINGELKSAFNSDDIVAYSIDSKSYFSKGYTDYVNYQPITSLFLDLEISL
ncbi:MAG: hypothetical protein JWR38_5260 [Mucilaginibacter sp.]|nr:hypothetical protein [Mucilaginibacter sp.]